MLQDELGNVRSGILMVLKGVCYDRMKWNRVNWHFLYFYSKCYHTQKWWPYGTNPIMHAELNSTLMNLTIVDVPGEKANKFHLLNLFISSVWLVWESNPRARNWSSNSWWPKHCGIDKTKCVCIFMPKYFRSRMILQWPGLDNHITVWMNVEEHRWCLAFSPPLKVGSH